MRVFAKYDDAFRADAVELVREGSRSIVEVARDLGVNHWTLRDWYRSSPMTKRRKGGAKGPRPPAQETQEQRLQRLERENGRLRKENESLRMDREILKKAAAFFAKENE